MACNPRNPRPGTVFNNANQNINVYGDDVEVGQLSPSLTRRLMIFRFPSSMAATSCTQNLSSPKTKAKKHSLHKTKRPESYLFYILLHTRWITGDMR